MFVQLQWILNMLKQLHPHCLINTSYFSFLERSIETCSGSFYSGDARIVFTYFAMILYDFLLFENFLLKTSVQRWLLAADSISVVDCRLLISVDLDCSIRFCHVIIGMSNFSACAILFDYHELLVITLESKLFQLVVFLIIYVNI